MKTLKILLLLLAATTAVAQKKVLTLDAVYDPTNKVYFSGAVQSGFEWLDDTTLLWPQQNERRELLGWTVFDVKTGRQRPYFEAAKMQKALEAAGLSADVAKTAAKAKSFEFDAKRTAVVLDLADDLYVYHFGRNTVARITSAPGAEELAEFSPDGQKVAFVRNNNLYVTDLSGRERQLTTDGNARLLNGKLDYVYQEEIYGRGEWRAFWWSPDSSRIAFLQLDESRVPDHTVVEHLTPREGYETFPYPKAGEPNPLVKLFVVPASGGARVAMDTSRYAGEHLIVNVSWAGDALTFQVQNREQTWLDLLRGDAESATTVLLRETTAAWVDPLAAPVFLADGSFLWQSERSGFRHLYHYRNGEARQVTNGEWEVRDFHGIDEKTGTIYFSGTERSVRDLDVYRINLDGSGLARISGVAGTHAALFNPSLTHYVDRWSDVRTPEQVRMHRADGHVTHVLEENRVTALAGYEIAWPELMEVPARDGVVMDAMMIRPPNFDPSKKYPVYHYVYGGPHAQEVRNSWRANRSMQHHLIAAQGVIVWMMDNRTASGKGARSAWGAYKNLGEPELRDIEDGIAWLKKQPYIDGDRIMIGGWSYGGFITAYALTHSKTFIGGVAGAPVTDWRNYDTVYTERMLLMPQNNPEGYRKSSPLFDAKDLHGRLLLIHGTTDDNVHLQNTIQFAYELQKAEKPFEMMLYATQRHTFMDPKMIKHMQATVLDFVRRVLLAP
ncbi:MAG TPA: S9 family peptidase [Thermoanaerobaculia bacterium]